MMNSKIQALFSALICLIMATSTLAKACGLRDNGATMTDPVTGIEIQKCVVGTTWTGSTCAGTETKFTFDQAVARFGQGEWRLITKAEAERVVGQSRDCPVSYSLTSSPYHDATSKPGAAWMALFNGGGFATSWGNSYTYPVLLVRAGQTSGGAATTGNNPQDDPKARSRSARVM